LGNAASVNSQLNARLVGITYWFRVLTSGRDARRSMRRSVSAGSVVGTNGTSRAGLAMSVDWGGPEVAG
jgi:hypothetical protein